MRRRRAGDEGPPVEVWGEQPPEAEPVQHVIVGGDRSRRAPLVMATVVIALVVLGLSIGGDDAGTAGGGDDETTTTETARTTTSRRSTTTSSTTTTFPPGPMLPATTGASLLALSPDSEWSFAELDTGLRGHVELDGDPFSMTPVRGGVVLIDRSSAWYAPMPVGDRVELGIADQVIPGDGQSVWLVRNAFVDDEDAQVTHARLVDLSGRVLAGPVEIPVSWSVGSTVRGMVLGVAGRTYLVDGSGIHALAYGEPRAAGGRTIVLVACDDRGACRPEVLDVVTGTGTPLAAPEPGFFTSGGLDNAYYVSPDGEQVLVHSFSSQGVWALYDRTGNLLGLTDAGFDDFMPPQWLPAGLGLIAPGPGQLSWLHLVDGQLVADSLAHQFERPPEAVLVILPGE